jgi:hypothetical protein
MNAVIPIRSNAAGCGDTERTAQKKASEGVLRFDWHYLVAPQNPRCVLLVVGSRTCAT